MHTFRRLALSLAIVLLAILAWRALASRLRPSIKASEITLAEVERGAVEASLSATGRVIAIDERLVTAPQSSRVVELFVRPGDRVELGQSLLELDTVELDRRLAELDERLVGLDIRRRQTELGSESTRLDLEQSLAIGRLEAREAEVAERRAVELSESGLIAAPDLDAARLRAQRELIEVTHLERRLETEAEGLNSRLAGLSNEARLLEAEREGALAELAAARVPAPVAGVVVSVIDRPGLSVALGSEIARIADLSAFAVEASFADSWADELAPGQSAIVEIAGARLDASVAAVYPAIEAGTVRLRLELDRDDHPALRSQLRVPVSVVTSRGGEGLRLARGRGIRAQGRQQLFVIEADRLVRRTVEVGLGGLDAWEILSGLQEGDLVAISDLSHLEHHQELAIKGDIR